MFIALFLNESRVLLHSAKHIPSYEFPVLFETADEETNAPGRYSLSIIGRSSLSIIG